MTSTQEQAQEAAAQAKDKAGDAAQQARGRARDQVDQRSTQAGERVSAQASDVRSVASALRDQGQDQPAKLADQAADRAERLGGYLQDADADRLLADIEDLGRRQPMALVFGGLALGFAASRFVKASSQERYAASQGGTSAGPAGRPSLSPPAYRTADPVAPLGTLGGTDTPFPDPVVADERDEPLAPRPPSAYPEPATGDERADGSAPLPPSTYPVWGR